MKLKGSKNLRKCIVCNKIFEKNKTEAWTLYENRKFCSIKCSVSKQFENGFPETTKIKISKSLKKGYKNGTIKSWNEGLAGYKRPDHSIWMKKYGHWRPGQTMEDRFGLVGANNLKNKLSKLRTNTSNIINVDKRKYYAEVWKFTNKQPLYLLENFNKRGKSKKGTDNYQVDHIISIICGYKKNIDSKIIGHINNLRMIHWKENIKRCRNYQ